MTCVIDSEHYIGSWDLYKALEISTNYPIWLDREVKSNIVIEENTDYFKAFHKCNKGRPRQNYMLNLTIAKHLCIRSGCLRGQRIKIFIQNNFERSMI